MEIERSRIDWWMFETHERSRTGGRVQWLRAMLKPPNEEYGMSLACRGVEIEVGWRFRELIERGNSCAGLRLRSASRMKENGD